MAYRGAVRVFWIREAEQMERLSEEDQAFGMGRRRKRGKIPGKEHTAEVKE